MIANEIIIHKKICPLKLSLYSLLYSFDACISHMILFLYSFLIPLLNNAPAVRLCRVSLVYLMA